MYYVPLFIIRGALGPSVKERRAGHEHLVDSWKSAIQAAEDAQHGGYWPVHVNGKYSIEEQALNDEILCCDLFVLMPFVGLIDWIS